MSFILDALKKSESERQQQGSAEFSQVPVSRESGRPPLWLWLLGALLVVNLVVLAGVLLRPAPERLPIEAVTGAGFAEQLEMEMQASQTDRSPPVNPETVPAATPRNEQKPVLPAQSPTQAVTAEPIQESAPAPARNSNITRGLPDIDQLRASGDLPVGELRLDIHVYSEVAADRFVFINMVKHREGSTTSDGLSVDAITPDGVVLTYRGRQFLLPRQ